MTIDQLIQDCLHWHPDDERHKLAAALKVAMRVLEDVADANRNGSKASTIGALIFAGKREIDAIAEGGT